MIMTPHCSGCRKLVIKAGYTFLRCAHYRSWMRWSMHEPPEICNVMPDTNLMSLIQIMGEMR